MPRPRLNVRTLMVVVVIAAGAALAIRILDPLPSKIALPRSRDVTMISVPTPIGPDGRGETYTGAEWADLIARMSAPKVLDAALSDPRVSRISTISKAPSPRTALTRCYTISTIFSQAQTDVQPALNIVNLSVSVPGESTRTVSDLTDALADAIEAHGPKGVEIAGRPLSLSYATEYAPLPPLRDWRVHGILAASILSVVAVIILSARPRRRAARGAVDGEGLLIANRGPIRTGQRPSL